MVKQFSQISKSIAIAFVLLFSMPALSSSSPVVMLESVTDKMIHSLKSNKSSIRGNPRMVEGFVKQYLLPHVDVSSMSRSVLGKQVWTKASANQQEQFTSEFQKLVIRTYSAALAEYDEQNVHYSPIRGGYEGKRFIQVNSLIKQRSGPNIRVNYRLVLHGSQWKVYDFSVDGISMVQSYRSQFAPIVNANGMDGVLAKLRSHNKS